MLPDGHLEVEPGEFAEMPPGVGVFGPKDGSHLEDPGEIGGHRHLFVDLGTLGQTRRRSEVVGGEDARSALGLPADELGRVDLDEPLVQQRFPKQLAHGALDSQDGVGGGGAEVHPAVVQTDLLAQTGKGTVRVLARVHVRGGAGGVLHLKGQLGLRSGRAVDALHRELKIGDRTGPYVRGGQGAVDVHHALRGEGFEILQHLRARLPRVLGLEVDRLEGVRRVSAEDEKGRAALDPHGGQTGADPERVSGAVAPAEALLVGALGEVGGAPDRGDGDEDAAGGGGAGGHGFVVAVGREGGEAGGGEVGHGIDAVGGLFGGQAGGFLGFLFPGFAFFLGFAQLAGRFEGRFLFLRFLRWGRGLSTKPTELRDADRGGSSEDEGGRRTAERRTDGRRSAERRSAERPAGGEAGEGQHRQKEEGGGTEGEHGRRGERGVRSAARG
mmetsp:Transcript_1176/g.2363  ORF Transcript_1176/g.2363 Transcript_1176/m.2363 type:complete len:442 (-) Transcript_1176:22-1347(-)